PCVAATNGMDVMPKNGFEVVWSLAEASGEEAGLGELPEWNLADLYPAMDSPLLKADLAKADADSVAFEERYKGKLAPLAAGPEAGKLLAEAIALFEQLEELL